MPKINGVIFNYRGPLQARETWELRPDCREVLDSLKKAGYKLCLIATPKWHDRKPKERIAELGLSKFFIETICEKNDLACVLASCADAMGLAYGEIAVVGDRVEKEIFAAKELGMKTIWFKNGKYDKRYPRNIEEQPHEQIDKLSDLIKTIQRIEEVNHV